MINFVKYVTISLYGPLSHKLTSTCLLVRQMSVSRATGFIFDCIDFVERINYAEGCERHLSCISDHTAAWMLLARMLSRPFLLPNDHARELDFLLDTSRPRGRSTTKNDRSSKHRGRHRSLHGAILLARLMVHKSQIFIETIRCLAIVAS